MIWMMTEFAIRHVTIDILENEFLRNNIVVNIDLMIDVE